MDGLHFSIDINAPKQKVWDVMLADKTYREWTTPFNPSGGSYFEGSWDKGSKILFLGPGEQGKPGGMVSKIVENRPYDFISIEHQGEVVDGKEDMDSPNAKAWAGAHENYTFTEKDGVTTLKVDLTGADIPDEFVKMFEGMWPKALAKLKELAERQ